METRRQGERGVKASPHSRCLNLGLGSVGSIGPVVPDVASAEAARKLVRLGEVTEGKRSYLGNSVRILYKISLFNDY